MATPILPIEDFVAYSKLQPEKNGRIILTGDYADMFGWDEQVKLVDSLYKSLPKNEKEKCIQITEKNQVIKELDLFRSVFQSETNEFKFISNGLFGYTAYDAIQYFEKINIHHLLTDK